MRLRVSLAMVAAALVLAAQPGPAAARTATIALRDNYFSTPYVLITTNDRVRWENEGAVRHTVRSYPDAPADFDSSPETQDGNCNPPPLLGRADCMEPGDRFQVRFREPGTYNYYCKVQGHADPSVPPDPDIGSGREQPCGMCGVIVVRQESSPPPLQRPSPSPSVSRGDPSPSPSATDPTASPTGEPTDPAGSPTPGSGSPGGSGGRLAVGFGVILALGGAGYWIWQRFLAPR